jgi:hypothetical protein
MAAGCCLTAHDRPAARARSGNEKNAAPENAVGHGAGGSRPRSVFFVAQRHRRVVAGDSRGHRFNLRRRQQVKHLRNENRSPGENEEGARPASPNAR